MKFSVGLWLVSGMILLTTHVTAGKQNSYWIHQGSQKDKTPDHWNQVKNAKFNKKDYSTRNAAVDSQNRASTISEENDMDKNMGQEIKTNGKVKRETSGKKKSETIGRVKKLGTDKESTIRLEIKLVGKLSKIKVKLLSKHLKKKNTKEEEDDDRWWEKLCRDNDSKPAVDWRTSRQFEDHQQRKKVDDKKSKRHTNRKVIAPLPNINDENCGKLPSPDEIDKLGQNSVYRMDCDRPPPNTVLGTRPSVVAGCKEAEIEEFPWMAGIYTGSYPEYNFLCSAAIISDRYAVTAAHCFDTKGGVPIDVSNYIFLVGRLLYTWIGNKYFLEKITVHPRFNPRELYHDIAVVRIIQRINVNRPSVGPICLPVVSPPLVGRNVTMAQWGDRGYFRNITCNALTEITIQVIDVETCDRAYSNIRGKTIPEGISDQFICAGVPKGGNDDCQRDSGGPLMLQENNAWFLVGVVSFGFSCAKVGYPVIYTRISSYLDWISDVTDDL